MGKFRKDGGKNKNKNSVFKSKKVKVGRKIKPALETVPQVKVGRIIIRDQLGKLDDEFVKLSDNAEVGLIPKPSHATLIDIKKKITSELKMCASDAKPADKKKFVEKVKRAIKATHCDLSSMIMKLVLEKICCPLMYDKNSDVRSEIPDLMSCLITKYTEANNIKHGMFPVTTQSCPLLSVSICRALSDSSCCLNALQVVGVACDLCPKLVQSDSANLLCKLLTILYRQTYFQIDHSSGEMKARSKYLDVEKLSQKTNSGSLSTWSLPKLIVGCDSSLLTRPAREIVLDQISNVFKVLSQPHDGIRCDYLQYPNNIMDNEIQSRLLSEVCVEILCAAWRDLVSTAIDGINSALRFNLQSFNLLLALLTCMKDAIQFVHSNCSSGKMFTSWLQSSLLDIFEESVFQGHPYSIYRRSNKNRELDDSATINKMIIEIKGYFTKYL